jgi:hypothetical protein
MYVCTYKETKNCNKNVPLKKVMLIWPIQINNRVRTVDASRYDYSHENIVSMNRCTSNYAEHLR